MSRSQDKQTWWKHRATEAERKLAEIHIVAEWIPVEYVDAVGAAIHIATNGRAGDGVTISRTSSSTPPKHDAEAFNLVRREQARLVQRAAAILSELNGDLTARKGAA